MTSKAKSEGAVGASPLFPAGNYTADTAAIYSYQRFWRRVVRSTVYVFTGTFQHDACDVQFTGLRRSSMDATKSPSVESEPAK